jgi:hypothetical protein
MDVTFSYPPQWTDVPAEPHDPEFSPLTQMNQMFPSWKRINEMLDPERSAAPGIDRRRDEAV